MSDADERRISDVTDGRYGWPESMSEGARESVLLFMEFARPYPHVPPEALARKNFERGDLVYAIKLPTLTPIGCISMGQGKITNRKPLQVNDIWYLPGYGDNDWFVCLKDARGAAITGMFRASAFGRVLP